MPVNLEDFKQNWIPLVYYKNKPIAVIVFGETDESFCHFDVFKVDGVNEIYSMFSGYLKWDGCSDIHFGIPINGYIHFCGHYDVTLLNICLVRAHQMASERLPHNDCGHYQVEMGAYSFEKKVNPY